MGKAIDSNRYWARIRKFYKAMQYMEDKGVIQNLELDSEICTLKETVELEAHFDYKGHRVRFDYELPARQPLLSVGHIRDFMMQSLGEYRESKSLPKW